MKKKQKIISEFNKKLLDSRKMFGMYGNIHWCVTDIDYDTLIVKVSSPLTNWGEKDTAGHFRPTKKMIANNIKESIHRYLPKQKVNVTWKKYNPDKDGWGFLISLSDLIK